MRSPTVAGVCLVVMGMGGAHAFVGNTNVLRPSCVTSARPRSCSQTPSMSGTGYATTSAGKEKTVEVVNGLLKKSSIVFSVPSAGIKANDVIRLRKTMPDGCTAKVVKNTLMRRACEGTEYEKITDISKGENFWMFVEGDDNLAAPIKFLGEFAKTMDKDNVAWQSPLKAGVFGGEILDGPGVLAISKLPTKQELMQRLAVALKSVPTKLGKSINLVPTKVGRAVKLAFADPEGAGGDAAESSAAETEASAEEGAGDGAPEAKAAAPAAEGAGEDAAAEEPAAPATEGGVEAPAAE